MKTYAWRSGLIEFGRRCPAGALLIAEGPARFLRPLVEVNATLAYDNKTLRVGNVASADSEEEALQALNEFRIRICAQLKKRLQAQQEVCHAQA